MSGSAPAPLCTAKRSGATGAPSGGFHGTAADLLSFLGAHFPARSVDLAGEVLRELL
jgi:hypothetical protein